MPNKDKLALGKHSIDRSIKSLRDKLKKYANHARIKGREEEYVKEQMEDRGIQKFYYPGISDAIKKGTVNSENSLLKSPQMQEWLSRPENAEQKNEIAKGRGERYTTAVSNLLPSQQKLHAPVVEEAEKIAKRVYPTIGTPTPLEKPLSDTFLRELEQYNKGTLANKYLSIFGDNEDPLAGLRQFGQQAGQSGLQGLQQLGNMGYNAGQSAYNTLNPYLQGGMARGQQLAQGGMNQAQSYLGAAQPYAQKAMGMGADIYNQVQGPALAAGRNTMQGLSNLLSFLKGG